MLCVQRCGYQTLFVARSQLPELCIKMSHGLPDMVFKIFFTWSEILHQSYVQIQKISKNIQYI